MTKLIEDILWLSQELETLRPELKIISISAKASDSFFINSADSNTRLIAKQNIGEYRLEPMLQIAQSEYITKPQIFEIITNAQISKTEQKISSEFLIHAIGLVFAEANYLLHSHSTKVNKVLASKLGAKAFRGHVFEESVIICGKNPASIKFAESGYQLATAIYRELSSFQKIYFHLPKILLLENHGVVILAKNPKELITITKTLELWAELIYAAYQLGGPNYLSLDNVMNIETENRSTQNQEKTTIDKNLSEK